MAVGGGLDALEALRDAAMALSDAEVSSEEGVSTGGIIVGWFSEKALAGMVKTLPVPSCGGLGVPRESKGIAEAEGKGSESISDSDGAGRWLIGAVDCVEEALDQVGCLMCRSSKMARINRFYHRYV